MERAAVDTLNIGRTSPTACVMGSGKSQPQGTDASEISSANTVRSKGRSFKISVLVLKCPHQYWALQVRSSEKIWI